LSSIEAFGHLTSLVECDLRSALESPNPLLARFYGMMQYHLGWVDEDFDDESVSGGKYVRPVLMLLACQAAGGEVEQAVPAAVAVELVHNFSLVHDDIEDNSDLRRHRPTVWKVWGNAQAINVGDGLFALAHYHMGRLRERGVGAQRALTATSVLDQTCIALTEGQFLDLLFESMDRVSLEQYLWMIRSKTAALLSCACEIGAVLATDDVSVRRALHQFGYNLGMAFQIEDDILGIWGDTAVTGKPACSDILSQKKTLPVVFAWNQGFAVDAPPEHQDAARTLINVYAAEAVSRDDVEEVLTALNVLDARAYCRSLSSEYTEQALTALSSVSLAPTVRAQMEGLANRLLGRSH